MLHHVCSCGKTYRLDDAYAGRSVMCAACKVVGRVDAEPVLILGAEHEVGVGDDGAATGPVEHDHAGPELAIEVKPEPLYGRRSRSGATAVYLGSATWIDSPLFIAAMINLYEGYQRTLPGRWNTRETGQYLMAVGAAIVLMLLVRGRRDVVRYMNGSRIAAVVFGLLSLPNPVASCIIVVTFIAACIQSARLGTAR